MRRFTLLFLCLLMVLPHTAYADSGGFMEGEVQVEPPGFLERAGAAILNNIARFLIEFLGLKDINTLVYQNEDRNLTGEKQDLIYSTFPVSVWDAIDRFYDIFSGVAYYLLAIAIMAWALMALFRAGDADGQLSLREMAVGVLIYVIGMYLAGHLIRLFFLVNDFIIAWSVDVLREYGYDPYTSGYIGEVITRITDSMEFNQTIGGALLFLVIVFVVAALNYQYVVRLLVMSVMIVLLPLVLFASIFPASRRAFDIWVREFAVQAWLPAAHAIAFSLFFAIMSERDPASVNFIMVISMLLALTSVAPLMRLVLGAPGGKISGALGFGSVAAISMMLRSIRGRSVRATAAVTPVAGAGMPNTNMAQGLGRGLALGAVASGISGASMAGGVTGAMAGKGAGDLLKSFGAGVVRQGVGMATGLAAGLAATAMTGNMEAGVLGAMKGHQVGKGVADKTMGFASGLYGHMMPKGGKAPFDIVSPGNVQANPQLSQPPHGILPPGPNASGGLYPSGGIAPSGVSVKPNMDTAARKEAGTDVARHVPASGMPLHGTPVKGQAAIAGSQPDVGQTVSGTNNALHSTQTHEGSATPLLHGMANQERHGSHEGKGTAVTNPPVFGQPTDKSDSPITRAEASPVARVDGSIQHMPHAASDVRRQTTDAPHQPEPPKKPQLPGSPSAAGTSEREASNSESKPYHANPQPPVPPAQPFKVKPPTGKDGNK